MPKYYGEDFRIRVTLLVFSQTDYFFSKHGVAKCYTLLDASHVIILPNRSQIGPRLVYHTDSDKQKTARILDWNFFT